jgi:cell division septation protein DedD
LIVRPLLAVLLLLNLVAYLALGPFDADDLPLPGRAERDTGVGLTLVTEADPVQLQSPPGRERETPAAPTPPVPATAGRDEAASSSPAPPELPATRRRGRVAICYTLGTLPDRLLVERVLGELRGSGLDATVRSEERRGDLSGYWVLLPQQPSLDEAQALIAELQQGGIDSFVVGTGEFRNAISLGFFHGRGAAEALEAGIRERGYEPRLVTRYRQETQYWLDLDEAGSERFDDARWQALAEAYPMLGRYVRDCG